MASLKILKSRQERRFFLQSTLHVTWHVAGGGTPPFGSWKCRPSQANEEHGQLSDFATQPPQPQFGNPLAASIMRIRRDSPITLLNSKLDPQTKDCLKETFA